MKACHGNDWAVSPVVVSSANGQQDGQQPACAGCAQLQRVLAETQSQLQAAAFELQATQAEKAQLAQLQQAQFGPNS